MTINPRKKSPPLYLFEDTEYFEARTKLAPTEAWAFKYLLQDMLPIEGGLHDDVYVGKRGTVFFTERFTWFFEEAENNRGPWLYDIKRRVSRTDRERLELWSEIANWSSTGDDTFGGYPVMSQYFGGEGEFFIDILRALSRQESKGYDTLFDEFESKRDLSVKQLCREAEYRDMKGLTMGDLDRVKDMLRKALVTGKKSALRLFLEGVREVMEEQEQKEKEALGHDEDDWS